MILQFDNLRGISPQNMEFLRWLAKDVAAVKVSDLIRPDAKVVSIRAMQLRDMLREEERTP